MMEEKYKLPLQIGGEVLNKHIWPGGISIIGEDGKFIHGIDIFGKYGNIAGLDDFPSPTDDPQDAGMGIRLFEILVGDEDPDPDNHEPNVKPVPYWANASGFGILADGGIKIMLSRKRTEVDPNNHDPSIRPAYIETSGLNINVSEDPLEHGLQIKLARKKYVPDKDEHNPSVHPVYTKISGLEIYSTEDPNEHGLKVSISQESGNALYILHDGLYVAKGKVSFRLDEHRRNIAGMKMFEDKIGTGGISRKGMGIFLKETGVHPVREGEEHENISGLKIEPSLGLSVWVSDEDGNTIKITKEGLYSPGVELLYNKDKKNISGLELVKLEEEKNKKLTIKLKKTGVSPSDGEDENVSGLQIEPEIGLSVWLSEKDGNSLKIFNDGLYSYEGVLLLMEHEDDKDKNISGLKFVEKEDDKQKKHQYLTIDLIQVEDKNGSGLYIEKDKGVGVQISKEKGNIVKIKDDGLFVDEKDAKVPLRHDGDNNISGLDYYVVEEVSELGIRLNDGSKDSDSSGLSISNDGLCVIISKQDKNEMQMMGDGLYTVTTAKNIPLRTDVAGLNISGLKIYDDKLGIQLYDLLGIDTSGLEITADGGLSVKLYGISLVNWSGLIIVPELGLKVSLYMNPLDASVNSSGLEIVPIQGVGGLRVNVSSTNYNALLIEPGLLKKGSLYAQKALPLNYGGENNSGLNLKDFTEGDDTFSGLYIDLKTEGDSTKISGLQITAGTGLSIVLSEAEGNKLSLKEDGLFSAGGVLLLKDGEQRNISGLKITTEEEKDYLSIELKENSALQIEADEGLGLQLVESTDEEKNIAEIREGGLFVPKSSTIKLLKDAEERNVSGLKLEEENDDEVLSVSLTETSGLKIEPDEGLSIKFKEKSGLQAEEEGLSIKISEDPENAFTIRDDGVYVKEYELVLLSDDEWENISGLHFSDIERDNQQYHMLSIQLMEDGESRNMSGLWIEKNKGVEIQLINSENDENISGLKIEPDSGLGIQVDKNSGLKITENKGVGVWLKEEKAGLEIEEDKGLGIKLSSEEKNAAEIKDDGLFVTSGVDLIVNEENENISGLQIKEIEGKPSQIGIELNEPSGLKIEAGKGLSAKLKEESSSLVIEEEGISVKLAETSALKSNANDGLSVSISEKENNVISIEENGLFVEKSEVKISHKEGNIITEETTEGEEGLFAPDTAKISEDSGNIISKRNDGLYAPKTETKISTKDGNIIVEETTEGQEGIYAPDMAKISEEEGNIISKKEDGIYAPDTAKISAEQGNIITKKNDGLYAPETEIKISSEQGNITSKKDDGLFTPDTAKASQQQGNVLVKKDDGLFVPKSETEISNTSGNIISKKDDGIYAPDTCKSSQESGNIITKKDDGLYASKPSIDISPDNGNIVINKSNGLFAPDTAQASQEQGNIITKKNDGLYAQKTEIKISQESGNIIVDKNDGLYAPEVQVNISQQQGNILEKKDDGLYAPEVEVNISQEQGNIILKKNDGLYAPEVQINISQEQGNIITKKDDGLYAPEVQINISPNQGNIITKEDNGLFVPDTAKASQQQGNIIEKKDDGLFAPDTVKVSQNQGNIIVKESDGLFAPKTEIKISTDNGNIIVSHNDGLFAPDMAQASGQSGNIISKKNDGLYASKTEIKVSPKSGNIITEETGNDEGLYAPDTAKASTEQGNIIVKKSDGLYAPDTVKTSQEQGNIITRKDDGLYAPDTAQASSDAGNIITKKSDGLYAPKTEIKISPDTGNIITNKSNGLFVPDTAQPSAKAGNVLTKETGTGQEGLYVPDTAKLSAEQGNIIIKKNDGLYASVSIMKDGYGANVSGLNLTSTSDGKNIFSVLLKENTGLGIENNTGLYVNVKNSNDNLLTVNEDGLLVSYEKLEAGDGILKTNSPRNTKFSVKPYYGIETSPDGVSVKIEGNSINKNANGISVKVSADSENIFSVKTDGVFVPKTEIKISPDTGNIITNKDNGLFAPDTAQASAETGNIIVKKNDGLYAPKTEIKVSTKSGNIIVEETGAEEGLFAPDTAQASTEQGNIIVKKNDGLYAPETAINISQEAYNILEKKSDGLYAKRTHISLKSVGNGDNISGLSLQSDTTGENILGIQLESQSGMQISENTGLSIKVAGDSGNIIQRLSTGLFVPDKGVKLLKGTGDANISGLQFTQLVEDGDEYLSVKLKSNSGMSISAGGDGLGISLSGDSGNIIQIKNDGLYASGGGGAIELLTDNEGRNISALKFVDKGGKDYLTVDLNDNSGLKIDANSGLGVNAGSGLQINSSSVSVSIYDGGETHQNIASIKDGGVYVSNLIHSVDTSDIEHTTNNSGLLLSTDSNGNRVIQIQISKRGGNSATIEYGMDNEGLYVPYYEFQCSTSEKNALHWDDSDKDHIGWFVAKVEISKESDNILVDNKGLYVPKTKISGDSDNQLSEKSDGLYVPKPDLEITAGSGISVSGHTVSVNPGNGISVSSGVTVVAGHGIKVDSSGVAINTGDGLDSSSGTVKAKSGNASIDVDASGIKVRISAGSGNRLRLEGDGVTAGDAPISKAKKNRLSQKPDGLYVPEVVISGHSGSTGPNKLEHHSDGLYLKQVTEESKYNSTEKEEIPSIPASYAAGSGLFVDDVTISKAQGNKLVDMDGLYAPQPSISGSFNNQVTRRGDGLWAKWKDYEYYSKLFNHSHYLVGYGNEHTPIPEDKKGNGNIMIPRSSRNCLTLKSDGLYAGGAAISPNAGNRASSKDDGLFAADGAISFGPNNGMCINDDGLSGYSVLYKKKKDDDDHHELDLVGLAAAIAMVFLFLLILIGRKEKAQELADIVEEAIAGEPIEEWGPEVVEQVSIFCIEHPEVLVGGALVTSAILTYLAISESAPEGPPGHATSEPDITPPDIPDPLPDPEPDPDPVPKPPSRVPPPFPVIPIMTCNSCNEIKTITEWLHDRYAPFFKYLHARVMYIEDWLKDELPEMVKVVNENDAYLTDLDKWIEEYKVYNKDQHDSLACLVNSNRERILQMLDYQYGYDMLIGRQISESRIWWFDWNDQFIQCPQTMEDKSFEYEDGWTGEFVPGDTGGGCAYFWHYASEIIVGFTGTARQTPTKMNLRPMADVRYMKTHCKPFPNGRTDDPDSGDVPATFAKYASFNTGLKFVAVSDGGQMYMCADVITEIKPFRVYTWGIGHRDAVHGQLVYDTEKYSFSAIKELKLPQALIDKVYHEDERYVYFAIEKTYEIADGLSDIYDDSITKVTAEDMEPDFLYTHPDVGSRVAGGYDKDNIINYDDMPVPPELINMASPIKTNKKNDKSGE